MSEKLLTDRHELHRGRRFATAAYLGWLAAVGLVTNGCSSAPPWTAAVAAREREALDEARRAEVEGRTDAALRACKELVKEVPQFVAAHRLLQNLELAEHRRGELLVRYRAWRDERPRAAERWYLWGRLLSGSEEQRAAFEQAADLDDTCPWPVMGLGALALAAGENDRAIELFRRARELAPDSVEIELALLRGLLASRQHTDEAEQLLAGVLDGEHWDVARVLLLADLRVRQERPRAAIEVLGRLLTRAPRSQEVATRLLERVERDGTVDDAMWLERELEILPDRTLLAPLMARCRAMRGDAAGALAAWSEAPRLSAEERAWRRLLLVMNGDLETALADEETRFAALQRVGGRTDAWDEARRIARTRASDPKAFDATALAAAFSRLGWVDEAIALLRPAATRSFADDAGNQLLVHLFGQRQLEAELRVLALETYRDFEAGKPAPSFDQFRERMGAAARRALGDDLLDGTRTLSFWPIGDMLDPSTESGLPGYFRQCGRLLVAGQRDGRPPELLLAPVLARGVAGPQRAELSFVEGTLIPGFLEHQGARFSGAALDRFVYVDVAAVEDEVARMLELDAKLGAERDRVLADPVESAASRADAARVVEPAEVATKLELRALVDWRARDPGHEPAILLAEALDAVLAHEIGHLEDAQRFLPLGEKIWSHLLDVARLRFSPRRIEEWFEMRAECCALARARNPYLVLAGCAAQLGGGSGVITPHGGGYRELLERFVAVIDDSPDEFPSVRRDHVLVQQLDLLTPAEIRSIAGQILADLGIE